MTGLTDLTVNACAVYHYTRDHPGWLPDEVCDFLAISRGALDAAVAELQYKTLLGSHPLVWRHAHDIMRAHGLTVNDPTAQRAYVSLLDHYGAFAPWERVDLREEGFLFPSMRHVYQLSCPETALCDARPRRWDLDGLGGLTALEAARYADCQHCADIAMFVKPCPRRRQYSV